MAKAEGLNKLRSTFENAKQKGATVAKVLAAVDGGHAKLALQVATGDTSPISRAAVAAATGATRAVAGEFRSQPPQQAAEVLDAIPPNSALLSAMLVQLTRIADALERRA